MRGGSSAIEEASDRAIDKYKGAPHQTLERPGGAHKVRGSLIGKSQHRESDGENENSVVKR